MTVDNLYRYIVESSLEVEHLAFPQHDGHVIGTASLTQLYLFAILKSIKVPWDLLPQLLLLKRSSTLV